MTLGATVRAAATRFGPRPALVDPEPVSGVPHGLAVLPAAAAMLRWKLHGNNR